MDHLLTPEDTLGYHSRDSNIDRIQMYPFFCTDRLYVQVYEYI